MNANREHKSSLFSELFNDPDELRILYNAIAHTNYNDETPIEINTLEDVFFKDQINDVSFTIGGKSVILIEHQSSINENMPLRCLMYIGRVFEKIISKRTMYKEKLLKIPTPEFIVFYNGPKPYPANKTLKLSDAYINTDVSQSEFGHLDLTVKVANINPGFNDDLKQKSDTLREYSIFVNCVRDNENSGLSKHKAMKEAIKSCIQDGILSKYLTTHGSEVENMLLTEWNWDDAKEVWQEEAREEAREEANEEWQVVVADKDAEIARLRAMLEGKEQT